jgi:hypothetical protein
MATPRTVDSIFRDVVMDTRASIKSRIHALEAIARPSVRFLAKVAGDASGPPRLRVRAMERLEHLVQLRKTIKRFPMRWTFGRKPELRSASRSIK